MQYYSEVYYAMIIGALGKYYNVVRLVVIADADWCGDIVDVGEG